MCQAYRIAVPTCLFEPLCQRATSDNVERHICTREQLVFSGARDNQSKTQPAPRGERATHTNDVACNCSRALSSTTRSSTDVTTGVVAEELCKHPRHRKHRDHILQRDSRPHPPTRLRHDLFIGRRHSNNKKVEAHEHEHINGQMFESCLLLPVASI